MIAQLRWVGSNTATAPIELYRLIGRITQCSRYASGWLLNSTPELSVKWIGPADSFSRAPIAAISRAAGRHRGEVPGT